MAGLVAAGMLFHQPAIACADGADSDVAGSEVHDLLDRAYAAIRDEDRDLALASLRDALLLAEDAALSRRIALQTGYLLAGMERPRAAMAMFLCAADIAADAEVLKALGYAAKSAGNSVIALDAFDDLLALTPHDPDMHLEAAYLLKSMGERRQAAHHFRRALELRAETGDAPVTTRDLLRQEIRYAENIVDGGVSLLWRASSRPRDEDAEDLSLGGQVLSQSQGLADIALPLPWPRPHGRLSLAGRMIWAIDGADPTPARDSLQGGIGLNFRPLPAANLVLSGERLIAIGDAARADWLIRLAWSGGGRLGAGAEDGDGWDWSLYGDAAVIGIDDTDIQLLGEGRFGRSWTLGRARVTGGAFLSGILQDDTAGTVELVEAGPSLALTLPVGGTPARAPGMALTLRTAWRAKLAGSAANRNSLTVTLSWRF